VENILNDVTVLVDHQHQHAVEQQAGSENAEIQLQKTTRVETIQGRLMDRLRDALLGQPAGDAVNAFGRATEARRAVVGGADLTL
jgi:hypothetical protein